MNRRDNDNLKLDSFFIELDADDARQATARVVEAMERQGFPVESGGDRYRIGQPLGDPRQEKRFGIEVIASNSSMGPTQAWNCSYALATELRSGGANSVHVEPTFRGLVELERSEEESVSGQAPDPPDDVRWHLKNARVLEAHEAFEELGRRPGQDVLIGHPDTGYTLHSEIFSGSPKPIHVRAGYNVLEQHADALDPLEGGVAEQPGHGTSTSSAMVAQPGVKVPREEDGSRTADLLGVAPGARVAPFRVTESVIITWWQRRLAEAIELAVEAGCRVISISLGGIGGRRLNRAIEYAESQGVVIVAASGNQVGFIVAPATHPFTVACAACDINNQPWSGTSHGRAISITAPGHQVWVAGWNELEQPIARPGSGTSFATAIVAASAALWISAHQDELESLRAQTAKLFRAALAKSARGLASLPSSQYGAGLLDCEKLIATAPSELDILEESMFEEELSPETIVLDSLLGGSSNELESTPPNWDLAMELDSMAQAELAFHLTVDRNLRNSWSSASEESPGDASSTGRMNRFSTSLRRQLRKLDSNRLGSRTTPDMTASSDEKASSKLVNGVEVESEANEIVIRINLNITVDVEHD